jgi:hypothetical protein
MTDEQDYRDRFSELEVDLWNAVTWTALLDKVVEDMDRLPGMSKREVNISLGQLSNVMDALKKAIYRLDANYHSRTEEEAVAAA